MNIRDLAYVIQAHNEHPRDSASRFRKWDGKTPYSVHPIWCAATILQETSLPEELRRDGSQALLYHDILEDTTAGLPVWISGRVKGLVTSMTFDSSEHEWRNLWERGNEVILFKAYDKTSNLMDGSWMTTDRRTQHAAHLQRICDHIEPIYGPLNIIRIARTLLQPSHPTS